MQGLLAGDSQCLGLGKSVLQRMQSVMQMTELWLQEQQPMLQKAILSLDQDQALKSLRCSWL